MLNSQFRKDLRPIGFSSADDASAMLRPCRLALRGISLASLTRDRDDGA